MTSPPLAIFSRLGEWQSFDPGLDRVENALRRLGSPQHQFRHVTVGGTNGKGTVCFNLAKHLPGKVGLFTSPHLLDLRERITIDGSFVPDLVWKEAYDHLIEVLGPKPGSYFEMLVLLAVVIFAKAQVDWAVFEVGLGGRDDAVNTLAPCCSVVTNVSLDHTDILGKTIEAIALRKIEIARRGCPMVLPASIAKHPMVARRLEAIGATLYPFEDRGTLEDNEQCFVKVAEVLKLAPFQTLETPLGRKSELRKGLYLDVSHNEASWRSTLVWLQTHGVGRLRILCNLSLGRDAAVFVSLLAPIAKEFIVLPVHYEKAYRGNWPAQVKQATWSDLEALLVEPVLVTGSSYFVGEFLSRYEASTKEPNRGFPLK